MKNFWSPLETLKNNTWDDEPLGFDLVYPMPKIQKLVNRSTENIPKEFKDSHIDRVQIKFGNGYDFSIIRGKYTYGGEKGLFEVMMNNAPRKSDYPNYIKQLMEDPRGHMKRPEVNKLIEKIANE